MTGIVFRTKFRERYPNQVKKRANQNLQKLKLNDLLVTASGVKNLEIQDWSPTRIRLDKKTMWEILQFSGAPVIDCHAGSGLFHASLSAPRPSQPVERPMVDIMVGTSPNAMVDTSDGGQAAPATSLVFTSASAREPMDEENSSVIPYGPIRQDSRSDGHIHHDSWSPMRDSEHLDTNDMIFYGFEPSNNEGWGPNWWDVGNL